MSWRVAGGIGAGVLAVILLGFARNWCSIRVLDVLRAKPEGHALTAAPTTAIPQVPAETPAAAIAAWPPRHRYNAVMARHPFVSGGQEDPCIPMAHNLSSRGNYEYHSSDLEKEWSDGSRFMQICQTARRQNAAASVWTKYTADIFKTNQQPQREPTPEEAAVLSYFDYPQEDGKVLRRYIEPLHGIARHPAAPCPGFDLKTMFDLKYLLPENACAENRSMVKGVLFDLGAGTTVKDFEDYDYARGSLGGGSIPLLYRMYHDRCIDFHAIYAWEVKPIDHKTFWEPLPDDIRARVRLYNNPVAENSCPSSPEGNFTERGSFLRLLKSSVTPEDYVVVKVDIDGGPELAIVESIAHLPELSSLIDELYFEYHFNFDGLPHAWTRGTFGGRTVDTAINLFLRLRQAGIRAHIWV